MHSRIIFLLLGLLLVARPLRADPIHDAVVAHDILRVRQMILEHPELASAGNDKGDTPLYIAAFRGYSKQMVPLLLELGADPNPPPNTRKETPLSIARELGKKQTVIQLLKAGAKDDDLSLGAEIRGLAHRREAAELSLRLIDNPHLVDAQNAFGQTALTLATADAKGDLNTVSVLLNAKANPNVTNIFGGSPFSTVIELNRTNMIALLRQHGGKENEVSRSAPFRQAVKANLLVEVERLTKEHPEFVRAHDDLNRTALHWAAAAAGRPIIELLLRNGADVNALDFADNTPLHAAATFPDRAEIVQLLLAAKADPNAVNRQQATSLHNAALAGSLASVKALLAAGAKLGVQDNHGETPLHRAATGGHVELIRFFLERGMDPNFRDRQRQTALHQAAEKGQADAVKFLLENKADPTLIDVGGMTPLQRAERYQHKAAVEVLSGVAAKKP